MELIRGFTESVYKYQWALGAWDQSGSGKLLTYPSPKSTLTLVSQLGHNVGFAEG